jgi:hypothetical protein
VYAIKATAHLTGDDGLHRVEHDRVVAKDQKLDAHVQQAFHIVTDLRRSDTHVLTGSMDQVWAQPRIKK